MFNQEEMTNLLKLISRATISGNEAMIVAMLQKKIQSMLVPVEAPIEETKEEVIKEPKQE